jgi:probable F420-dependent oxidoreductase
MPETEPRLGVAFPQSEIGAGPAGVRTFVEALVAAGYDHLVMADHVLGADRSARPDWPPAAYDSDTMFHEPFTLFGYVAAIAPELELATDVIILPQRQTALVAKQAAEVDVLTGGRFRLGVGLGWNAVEYEGLGMPFKGRGRAMEEQIDVLRRLFAEPVVTYAGDRHTITAAGINPMPVQRPIPIWIGGGVEAALRRAARLADGFFVLGPLEGHTMPETIALLRRWVEEAGRDPAAFGIEAHIDVARGTPGDWRAAYDEWRALGASHVALVTLGGGLGGPDEHAARITEAMTALR